MSALGLKNVSPGVPSSQIPPWRIWNVEEASSVEQTVQRHPIPGELKVQRALVLCSGGWGWNARADVSDCTYCRCPSTAGKRKVIHSLNSGMAWTSMPWCFIFFKKIYFYFIYLVVAHRIFSCCMWTLTHGMWYLAPWPGIKPGPPALVVRSLSCWTTREVPMILSYISSFRNSIIMTTYKYDLIKKDAVLCKDMKQKNTPECEKWQKVSIHSFWVIILVFVVLLIVLFWKFLKTKH